MRRGGDQILFLLTFSYRICEGAFDGNKGEGEASQHRPLQHHQLPLSHPADLCKEHGILSFSRLRTLKRDEGG